MEQLGCFWCLGTVNKVTLEIDTQFGQITKCINLRSSLAVSYKADSILHPTACVDGSGGSESTCYLAGLLSA